MSPKMWNTQVSIMLCNDTEISNKEKKEYSEKVNLAYNIKKKVIFHTQIPLGKYFTSFFFKTTSINLQKCLKCINMIHTTP